MTIILSIENTLPIDVFLYLYTTGKTINPEGDVRYKFIVNKHKLFIDYDKNGIIAQAEKVSNIVVVRNYAYRHYSEKCPPKWK